MAALGHSVHFIGDRPPQRLDLSQPGIAFHPTPNADPPAPGDAFGLAATLAAVSQAANLDVIHAHYARPHAVAAVLARDLGSRALS